MDSQLKTLATEVLGLIQAQTGPVEGQLTSTQFEEAVKAAASRVMGGAEQVAVQAQEDVQAEPNQSMALNQPIEESAFFEQSIELSREFAMLGQRLMELEVLMVRRGRTRLEMERLVELMAQCCNAIQQSDDTYKQRQQVQDPLEKRRIEILHFEAARERIRLVKMLLEVEENWLLNSLIPVRRDQDAAQNPIVPPVPPPTAVALPASTTGPSSSATAPVNDADDQPIQPRVTRSQTAQIPANNTRSKRTGAGNSGIQKAKKQKKSTKISYQTTLLPSTQLQNHLEMFKKSKEFTIFHISSCYHCF